MTVTCVDDPPVAVNDSATLAEDAGATAVDVLANDTDVDGGPKEVIVQDQTAPTARSRSPAAGTVVTYTPDANYCGPDSFTYTLNGGSTATVSMTVDLRRRRPRRRRRHQDRARGLRRHRNRRAGQRHRRRRRPQAGRLKTNGAHGTVAITGGGTGAHLHPRRQLLRRRLLHLHPQRRLHRHRLGHGHLRRRPAGRGRRHRDAWPRTPPRNAIDVLANDTDIDGGPKQVTAKTNGAHGTVAITGGGTGLTYTPDANYCGPDSFTYTLNGGSHGHRLGHGHLRR